MGIVYGTTCVCCVTRGWRDVVRDRVARTASPRKINHSTRRNPLTVVASHHPLLTMAASAKATPSVAGRPPAAQLPLGVSAPISSSHATVLSLPTLANLIGYETGCPSVRGAVRAGGYPRFVQHAWIRQLTVVVIGRLASPLPPDTTLFLVTSTAAATALLAFVNRVAPLPEGCGVHPGARNWFYAADVLGSLQLSGPPPQSSAITPQRRPWLPTSLSASAPALHPALRFCVVRLTGVGHVDADEAAVCAARSFLQHTGAQIGSRLAEDALLLVDEEPAGRQRALVEGGAAAVDESDCAVAAATQAAGDAVRAAVLAAFGFGPNAHLATPLLTTTDTHASSLDSKPAVEMLAAGSTSSLFPPVDHAAFDGAPPDAIAATSTAVAVPASVSSVPAAVATTVPSASPCTRGVSSVIDDRLADPPFVLLTSGGSAAVFAVFTGIQALWAQRHATAVADAAAAATNTTSSGGSSSERTGGDSLPL